MNIQERVEYYLNNINDAISNNNININNIYLKENDKFEPNELKILNFDLLLKELNANNSHPNFKMYGITLYYI